MKPFQKIEYWADHHHPKWLDFIRIFLGLLLITKGVAFIFNRQEVIRMLESSSTGMSEFLSFYIAHYVIVAFIVGGLAVAVGFISRWAILFQMPAVIGAIIMVDFHKELFALNSQLGYSIMFLVLMLFFLLYGSGNFSLDHWLMKWKE